MNARILKRHLLAPVFIIGALTQPANALVIGHFDNTRELYGMSTGYLSGATQWLADNGHTLVSTSEANASFLSTVDAFYTGLIGSVDTTEISAFQSFVDVDGGARASSDDPFRFAVFSGRNSRWDRHRKRDF